MKRKVTTEILQRILDLKLNGYSSRKISKELNVSKSAINDNLKDWFANIRPLYDPKDVAFNRFKILFLDVESAPDISVNFTRFKANMTQDHILQDGGWFITAAFAFNNEPVKGYSLTPDEASSASDARLVACLYEAVDQADLIVAHNATGFDWPLFKARCLINGFPPPKRVRVIDTLKQAKQMKFQSNRLGSLGKFFSVGDKLNTSGIDLWVRCMKGDEDALLEMLKYNIQDVELLRNVYNKLKAYDDHHPNVGLYTDNNSTVCRVCGSTNMSMTGDCITTNLSKFDEYICNDCNARSRSRVPITTKEQRAMLVS